MFRHATSRLYLLITGVILALFILAVPAWAEDVRGARFPALSPDDATLAFEYWGDLWTMPVDGSLPARRITDHLAWDYLPRYSPDGEWIAFVSDRSGNDDIWVIPAAGGPARQVTRYSGGDTLCNWTVDGERILFSSQRGNWSQDLYSIDADGTEPPRQITRYDHYNSSDADTVRGGLVFARGNSRWWRKGYRGTVTDQLWWLTDDGNYLKLTEHNGRNSWPMASPDGDVVYYVCDEDGIDNIWSLELESGQRQQLTRFKVDGVQWPSISPARDTIVFEQDGWLYRLDVPDGRPQQVPVRLDAEGKDNLVQRRDFNNNADEYAVSPHGKYLAVVHAGDLWAVKDPEAYKDEDKPDQDLALGWRLTASDDARERNPAFAPDNRHLAYASDADGDYEIYLLDLHDMSRRQLTDNDVDDLSPQFDPQDSDVLFYFSGNRALVRHELAADKTTVVTEGRLRDAFAHLNCSVSPDGAWVAYVEEMSDWSSEIFIIDARGEDEPVNITRHPGRDADPRWSADGRRLVFTRHDEEDDAVYVVDLNPEPETYDLTFLFEDDRPDSQSSEADKEPDADEDENGDDNDDNGDEDDDTDDNGTDDQDKDKHDDKAEQIKGDVVIDFTDIHLRARRVSRQNRCGRALLSDDGEWVLYTCNPDDEGDELWAVKAEGGDAHKIQDGNWSDPVLAAKGKRLYYRDGGTVRYLKYDDGKSKGRETINARGEFWLDQRARWRQMFREGWRTLGERFYDPEMHGADWPAMYEKYSAYIDTLGTPEEFGLVFTELLGELNASHLGLNMNEHSYGTTGVTTGHPGLEFDPAFAGPGLRVAHVVYQGPADQPGVDIAEGDIVLEVAGQPVDFGLRWLDLFDDQAGRPLTLTVVTGDGAPRDVTIKPITYGAYTGLLYREWELQNEATVDELSRGRIGYIHIRSMSRGELAKFEREFFSEFFDKDALIVDVRFNPGGWIHEPLFELLDRNPFGFANQRDEPWTMQPPGAFLKPKALLINACSGSDAEIFPAGWRRLGLGPIVGIDTAGAVIGTSGFTLIDGSWVRLPLQGWFELDGRNLEQSGTPPDIYIDVDPAELRDGFDAQLARAVEVLLEELESTEEGCSQ
ncbi:PD40 domain-containing protein [bacterium]|nr:PD40 domain-containing protein [bacterium]